jgi:hypothetical protein
MISHAEAEELLGAYALDAVDREEAEAVEAHLEDCPRCRDELRNNREVVGMLAYAGHEAPPGLWDRVVAQINETAAPGGAEQAGPSLRLVRVDSSGSDAAGSQVHRLRRRARFVSTMAAAAALIVALLGVQVVRLENRTNHIDHQLQAISGPQVTMATVDQALKAPGAHLVALKSLTGGQASLEAVMLPSGQSYLYDIRLDPLSSSQTYQLWGLVGSEKISYGILGNSPAQVVSFRSGVGIDALAVTSEVAGGATTPHTPIVFGSVD